MNTESVVKLLLLAGVIYLIVSCLNNTENFTYDLSKHDTTKPINIGLFIDDIKYVFISFEDLKKEHKDKVIAGLKENKKFANPKAPAKNENSYDMANGNYIKVPIFIVKESEVSNLTDNKTVGFKLKGEKKYRLVPVVSGVTKTDKFLFDDEDLGMIYYSNTGNNFLLVNVDGLVEHKKLLPVTFGDLKLNVFGKEKVSKDDKKYKVVMTQ
jgi:hypothetical protein